MNNPITVRIKSDIGITDEQKNEMREKLVYAFIEQLRRSGMYKVTEEKNGNVWILRADLILPKKYEPEPVKHGRWIDFPECLEYEGALDEEYFVCSECHHVWNTMDNCAETFRYCPNCGSKNEDGDSDDEP
jgi:NADH pyrophosphatase NudC (nudix superfamily)